MFLNALLNGLFQVVLFGLIPFIWWFFTARKKEYFLYWIGIRKIQTTSKKQLWISFLGVLIVGYALGQVMILLQGDVPAAQSQYSGMGISAVPSGLAYALIQTSLSEEILFRGFLLKRLSIKLGFRIANLLQALIFGVLHLVLLWGNVAPWYLILAVLYPMAFAMALAWLNEKQAEGSIFLSWCVHAVVNALSQLLAIF